MINEIEKGIESLAGKCNGPMDSGDALKYTQSVANLANARSCIMGYMSENLLVRPIHEVADAFWDYWRENGETHKHGHYEATWGALNAALGVSVK